MKPTYRKSWARNLLMCSDLTLGPTLKVKRWFTGFGELSFRWIQICLGSPMRRSSCTYYINYLGKLILDIPYFTPVISLVKFKGS